MGSHTTTLCGRNAVQVAVRRNEPLNFPELAGRLAPLGEVRHNAFMLRFATEGYEFTVFPDGRAIIKGTNDIAKAQNAVRPVRGELTRPPSVPLFGAILIHGQYHDLPRQRRDQLSQARAGLPGARSLRPHEPGQPGPGRATGWPWPRSGCSTTRGIALNQFFDGEAPGAMGLHAQLHRRTEHGHQGARSGRATTSSPPTWSTTR